MSRAPSIASLDISQIGALRSLVQEEVCRAVLSGEPVDRFRPALERLERRFGELLDEGAITPSVQRRQDIAAGRDKIR
jgi:hypothetical protein